MEIAIVNEPIQECVARFSQCICDVLDFNNRIAGIMAVSRHGKNIADPRLTEYPPAIQWVSPVFVMVSHGAENNRQYFAMHRRTHEYVRPAARQNHPYQGGYSSASIDPVLSEDWFAYGS